MKATRATRERATEREGLRSEDLEEGAEVDLVGRGGGPRGEDEAVAWEQAMAEASAREGRDGGRLAGKVVKSGRMLTSTARSVEGGTRKSGKSSGHRRLSSSLCDK